MNFTAQVFVLGILLLVFMVVWLGFLTHRHQQLQAGTVEDIIAIERRITVLELHAAGVPIPPKHTICRCNPDAHKDIIPTT